MPQEKMSPAKSHLLAYLKHTPGLEGSVPACLDLTTGEIMARVKEVDPQAHRTCVYRFKQRGVSLETATLPQQNPTRRPKK